jgi:hypothetical protein
MKKALLVGGGLIGAYLIFKAIQKKKTDKATESMRIIASKPVNLTKPVRRPPNMPIEERKGAVPILDIQSAR